MSKSDRSKEPTDLERVRQIKKLALISMFSDDEVMQMVVLKGGNALDLVYDVGGRASQDLDFSVPNSFPLAEVEDRVKKSLETTFSDAGYRVFDIRMYEKPLTLSEDMKDFWGGHVVEFKVADAKNAALPDDIEELRKLAIPLTSKQERKFYIEISNYEYCEPKAAEKVEGYRVYVYTPEMLAIEKLRAICQQFPEYRALVKSPGRNARARDFYDIWLVCERFGVAWEQQSTAELIRNIFGAKKVDLSLLRRIHEVREFHRPDFDAVKATVPPGTHLEDYDYYFKYVLAICQRLESLGVV